MGMLKGALLSCLLSLSYICAFELKVSVYYESYCPDSISFVIRQLYPTTKHLGNVMDIELIPWGFASATNDSGKWEFTCQHGPDECYGNKVLSCAGALYHGGDSVEFLNCAVETGPNFADKFLEGCAQDLNLNWSDIHTCVTSGQGDKLLLENGEKTAAVVPKIKFIPTIIINDHFNQTYQDKAMTNFLDLVCELLNEEPEGCKTKAFQHALFEVI